MANLNSLSTGSATITGGSISGTPVSGSTGSFTTLNASGAATLNNLSSSGATITGGTVGGTVLATNSALVPHVANLAALQGMSTANSSTYYRDGYTSTGDGGGTTYVSSGSACSLNSGNGDNGSQVKSADGKCWLAVLSPFGADIRIWGAVANGSTDAGPAVNACFAVTSICLIPPSTSGFLIGTAIAIPAGDSLIGTVSSGENTSSTFTYPGFSWLTCSASLSGACVTWGTQGTLKSGVVKNITIARAAGTPTSGQKGLVWAGGYNVRMENVAIANFDTCVEFQRGISGQGVNNYLQSCATHYWVFNTWPEFSQVGGRSGANGSGNYNTATDNVYFTSTISPGGGGTGPNSIDFVNYKFENDNTTCAFRWGQYTYAPGAEIAYNFVNVYKEPLPSGSSVFCSDGTVSLIQGLRMENSYISQDTGPSDLFSGLNAATQLANWNFIHNYFATGAATLAPTGTGTTGLNNVTFFGNYMPNTTITPGGTIRSDKLTMMGNFQNNTLTINNGTNGWQQLTILGDQQNTFTNNSDGYNQVISLPRTGYSSGLRITSTLPTCNSATKGYTMTVTDATSPTYGATLTGGGSVVTPVFCTGSSWVTH
ncbi:hypothetical protein [Burkholderia sp. BCC0405]|uniref:hypothetical protein n=1 Tax=Burkholderia sp. BCC0405 TaxID=2676298 RepID=UPI00158B41E0|nr:hypothetical protein [Burkholderia sp. BCC0405]